MTDIKSVTKKILAFRNARDWRQFHTLKNLAASISIEAAELLECFQWEDVPVDNTHCDEEAADIAIYLFLFCDAMKIDLLKAIEHKLAVNEKKYPVEKAKGSAVKYDKL